MVAPAAAPRRKEKPRKLSFREQKELDELPDRIDALEQERASLYAALADPAFLRDGTAVAQAKARLDAIDGESSVAMLRWEELEAIAAASAG